MDNLSKQQRKFCMSRIRSRNTQPEKAVREVLTKMGWKYRLYNSRLPGKPDIVISKIKTVFFINGCFWHQHKNCRKSVIPKENTAYWIKKLKRNVEKQIEDIKTLKKEGWKVYKIWECQMKDKKKLTEKIQKCLSVKI